METLRSAFNSLDLAFSTPENDKASAISHWISWKTACRGVHITMDKGWGRSLPMSFQPCKSLSVARMLMPVSTTRPAWIEAEDPPSLARRLTVIAYEDIGLANPWSSDSYRNCSRCCSKDWVPRARILIANVVIDLALSPKSNSAYVAMDKALTLISKHQVIYLSLDTCAMVITVEERN